MGKTQEEIYKEYMAQQQKLQQQADDYLAAYDNRPAFSYDASADPTYRAVRDQYIHQGQRAMQDTMGQAAALTGGYNSSYGQAVGNQAFNEYMTKLSGIAGEYAQQARAAYDAEGQRMLDRYGMAQNAADNAYAQGRDALADQRYDQERNYSMAMQMIQAGQTPDAALLQAAGIDPGYAQKMAAYYAAQLQPVSGGGGSGGGGGGGSRYSSGGGTMTQTPADTTTTASTGGAISDANYKGVRQTLTNLSRSGSQADYDRAIQVMNSIMGGASGTLSPQQQNDLVALFDYLFGSPKKTQAQAAGNKGKSGPTYGGGGKNLDRIS